MADRYPTSVPYRQATDGYHTYRIPAAEEKIRRGQVAADAARRVFVQVSADDGTEGRYDGGHALLSDDGGTTWRIGYVDDNPDGCRIPVAEMAAVRATEGGAPSSP